MAYSLQVVLPKARADADINEFRTVAETAFAMMEMETAYAPIGKVHMQVEFPDDFVSRMREVSRLCGGQTGGDKSALG
jgi:hypothetical protein